MKAKVRTKLVTAEASRTTAMEQRNHWFCHQQKNLREIAELTGRNEARLIRLVNNRRMTLRQALLHPDNDLLVSGSAQQKSNSQ